MTDVTAKDIQALRQATGAGMMDAKRALTEASGEAERAAEILFRKADFFVNSQQFDSATDQYQKILRDYPADLRTYHQRGKLQEYQRANRNRYVDGAD